MKLKFVTSISKNYWKGVGKHCISTWDLPGKVEIYIDQHEGDVEWFNELPFNKRLLHIPALDVDSEFDVNTKIRKFWGKSVAQIHAIKNRQEDERIIWLDADIEQMRKVPEEAFSFPFINPVAMMQSNNSHPDCYESGLVLFNEEYEKLTLWSNKYWAFWNDQNKLESLHKPYDAIVLGNFAKGEKAGFLNLCDDVCENVNALENTRFSLYFKHHINKTNKDKLKHTLAST